MPFDIDAIRREFPMLRERRFGQPLVYLDSAGSALRPQCVIERVARFERKHTSGLAAPDATTAEQLYAQARARVAHFIGAAADEIVFCRGATEAINLVAQTWGEANVGDGDEILVTELEHHANLAPWHALARRRGARVRTIPVDVDGNLTVDACERSLGSRVKLLAITQASNVLGTIPPLAEIVAAAHRVGARVLVDGAQASAHLAIDVRDSDVDFYTFSGHKAYGPSDIGVLFGKRELLEAMPPWQLGANVIEEFDPNGSRYAPPPARFEAGSANIAGAVGLAAALDWLDSIGFDAVQRHEAALFARLVEQLKQLPAVRLLGAPTRRVPIVSFCVDGTSAADVRDALAREGIEARAGHLAAQPLLRRLGVEQAVRVSLGICTDMNDVRHLTETLASVARAPG